MERNWKWKFEDGASDLEILSSDYTRLQGESNGYTYVLSVFYFSFIELRDIESIGVPWSSDFCCCRPIRSTSWVMRFAISTSGNGRHIRFPISANIVRSAVSAMIHYFNHFTAVLSCTVLSSLSMTFTVPPCRMNTSYNTDFSCWKKTIVK